MNRTLSTLEFSVLAVLKTGATYGEEVRRMVRGNGSTAKALARMELRGLVASEWSEPISKRGGRSRRVYHITKAGQAALRQTEAFYRSKNMSDTPELKPCPFCGGKAEMTKHFREDIWRLLHRCPVVGAITIDWSWRERLVAQWNTRNET